MEVPVTRPSSAGDTESNKGVLISIFGNMMAVRWKTNWFVLLGFMLVGIVVYGMMTSIAESSLSFKPMDIVIDAESSRGTYNVWPIFRSEPDVDSSFFRQHCASVINFTMSNLIDVKQQWSMKKNLLCRELFDKFSSIFTMERREAPLQLPTQFAPKVKHWLGDNEGLFQQVYNQEVIHVVSEYMREHTIFNSLRDKRPVSPPDEPEEDYFNKLLEKTAKKCDFCNYKENTAEHVFGRVESEHSFTASNAFKLDTLHALVAPKKHDPLHWTKEEFLDLFGLVKTWLKKAHKHYPDSKFPSLIWDVLPKCGASQVHPHLHVMMDPKRYHGQIETWRQGAEEYFANHGSNFFTDMVSIYSALNLTVTHGSAVAFANLVPKRDHEMIIMSKEADEDFHTLLFLVLRAFIDSFGVKCFSMGMALPAMNHPEGKLPAYARIITRGYVTDIRTDISSFELFMAASVNIDPYKTVQTIREYVRKAAPMITE